MTKLNERDDDLNMKDLREKFPQIVFKSTSMKRTGEKTYKLKGKLTIRDITKAIELDVTHNGTVKDPWGHTVAGFKITGTLNRFDFGLKWNTLMEAGGAVVGKEVRLNINAELRKKS